MTPGYVSRLLEALVTDGLIERTKRGTVLAVKWRQLLERRAECYAVFTSNRIQRFVCPNRPAYALEAAGDVGTSGSERLPSSGIVVPVLAASAVMYPPAAVAAFLSSSRVPAARTAAAAISANWPPDGRLVAVDAVSLSTFAF